MNETINEQRYQFVLSLYRIRTQYPKMGLFQPDFIWVIFRKMMPSKYNRTDADIQQSVNEWCNDPTKAEAKYGHISEWNTSLVTDMNELFKNMSDFNDDISKWNVSNVTDMSWMFNCYTEYEEEYEQEPIFNGDISGWDVSSVTSMYAMFSSTPFNGDIYRWNILPTCNNVTDLMFNM